MGLLLQSLRVSDSLPAADLSMDTSHISQIVKNVSETGGNGNGDTSASAASSSETQSCQTVVHSIGKPRVSFGGEHYGGGSGDGDQPDEHRSINLKRRYDSWKVQS